MTYEQRNTKPSITEVKNARPPQEENTGKTQEVPEPETTEKRLSTKGALQPEAKGGKKEPYGKQNEQQIYGN